MRWVSIDPGLKRTGWAYWEDDHLREWGLITCKDINTTSWYLKAQLMAQRVYLKCYELSPAVVVSEFPQEMNGGRGAVALASGAVRKLAAYVGIMVGKIACNGIRFEIVEPMTWKGQLPKEITIKRVMRDYPQVPADLYSDVYDAIGIGRWRVRQERKRRG